VNDPALILMVGLLPILIVASGFFSGAETALFSLTQQDRRLMTREQSLVGSALATLLRETRSLLITLLLGNMTINVLYFVISTVILMRLQRVHQVSPTWITVLSVTPLIMLILCGELMPKLIAARVTVIWSRFIAIPLLVVHRVLGPLRIVVNALVVTPLARLIAPSRQPTELSTDELETLLELSQQKGLIDHAEEELLQQVLELGQLKVSDVMTPRVDIDAHQLSAGVDSLLTLIRETRLSRIPVYGKDVDEILGIVFTRQILLRPPQTSQQLESHIKQVLFVPEQQRADQLLVQLRKTGNTFAIVVDEYGGTAGLITLEDIVEAMVGPIAGPSENGHDEVQQVSPGHWRVSAALPVHEWEDFFGDVRKTPGLKTIGGLVMARLGRLPRVGDRITVGNVRITVEKMDGSRLLQLEIHLAEQAEQQANAKRGGA